MQFLKTLFWCLLAFSAAVFAIGNWTWVPIQLFGGLVAETNLPFLLLVTFLLGLLPMYAYHHATRWRLRQRLGAAEQTLANLRALDASHVAPALPDPTPVTPMLQTTPAPLVTPAPPATPTSPVTPTGAATIRTDA